MYINFKGHSQNDLEQKLEKSINVNTLLLTSALEDTYTTFEQKKNMLTHIHRTALDELSKDENISLEDLKSSIRSHFNFQHLDVDFYIINKEYVITDATFEKDIGLDFKKIPDGKMSLDKASKDNEIHIAEKVAIDYLDSTFKIYSCAKLNNDKYLEIALVDPFSYRKLRTRIANISKSTKNQINLFRIRITASNEEYYEDILNTETISNKKEWNEALKKFPLNSISEDRVINAKRQNTIIRNEENIKNGKVSIYVPILPKENVPSLDYHNFVMKLEIDINDHIRQWKEYENSFILVSLVLLALMLLLYFVIKYNFYIPITTITQNLENEGMVDDPVLLNDNNEFGILSNKYNLLYSKLQEQIKHNRLLLNENKQFITDMVHQIRTPLTVIMTNTSLIEMKTKEKVSSYIAQINSAINMLSNSYEDLSYIISNDTIEYKPMDIDLTNFLDERIDFFELIAEANGKTIHSNIANDLSVYMNDIELERLIDNNLSNAIKHSNDKSQIEVLLEKSNSEIILKFISKGQEIYDTSKIFYKGYTETYGAKRSLGLGLNMVSIICEKNNITYSVHSEEGINTFTYVFKV
jgi:signal transduction histidine kinase